MDLDEQDWSSVEMTPRARQRYDRFLAQYRRYLKKVQEFPLALLVWGPGPSGGDLYRKRLEIRAQLRDRGFAAVFSEEVERDCPVPDMSLRVKELLQLCSADLVVVIQASFGSVAEVHDFASLGQAIGGKLMIFIDSTVVGGYSSLGALRELGLQFGNVHYFEYPKDVVECHLSRKVIERAEALRHAAWQRKNLKNL
jgi:hypothetical protein